MYPESAKEIIRWMGPPLGLLSPQCIPTVAPKKVPQKLSNEYTLGAPQLASFQAPHCTTFLFLRSGQVPSTHLNPCCFLTTTENLWRQSVDLERLSVFNSLWSMSSMYSGILSSTNQSIYKMYRGKWLEGGVQEELRMRQSAFPLAELSNISPRK